MEEKYQESEDQKRQIEEGQQKIVERFDLIQNES